MGLDQYALRKVAVCLAQSDAASNDLFLRFYGAGWGCYYYYYYYYYCDCYCYCYYFNDFYYDYYYDDYYYY